LDEEDDDEDCIINTTPIKPPPSKPKPPPQQQQHSEIQRVTLTIKSRKSKSSSNNNNNTPTNIKTITTDLSFEYNSDEELTTTASIPSQKRSTPPTNEIHILDDVDSQQTKRKKLSIPSLLFSDDDLKFDKTLSKTITPILCISERFSLHFTKPFWMVTLVDREPLYLDYRKPIFTVPIFLKIVNYFNFNKAKIVEKSKFINDLKDLVMVLKPYSTLFVESEESMQYLRSEIDNLLKEEKNTMIGNINDGDSVKFVNNLQYLLLEHLQVFDMYYENQPKHQQTRKNLRKLQKAELLLKKEFNGKTIKLFENRQKSLYFESHCSLYNFTQSHLLPSKFQFYNHLTNSKSEFHIDPSLQSFHQLVESLVISRLYYKSGEYLGDVTLSDSSHSSTPNQHIPHGYGTWKSTTESNHVFYSGWWVCGVKEGHGILQTNDLHYEGEWKDDEMSGYGVLKVTGGYHGGSVYFGNFANGKRQGRGVQFYRYCDEEMGDLMVRDESGHEYHEWYRGEWVEDLRNGRGEFRTKYEWKSGLWKNHELRDGIGVIREVIDPSEAIVTDQLCSMTIFEKFKKTTQKAHIPSTLLPHIFHMDGLQKLNIVDAIVVFGNQQKTPKRTIYNGYCFRSRLEAKWAKFFEYCNVPYEYESKTFELRDGSSYTPDFYLPSMNCWLEIKPTYPSEEERVKAQLLTEILQPNAEGCEGDEFERRYCEKYDPKPRVLIVYGDVNAPFVKKYQSGAMAIEFFSTYKQSTAVSFTNRRITPPKTAVKENIVFSSREPLGWCQCPTCGEDWLWNIVANLRVVKAAAVDRMDWCLEKWVTYCKVPIDLLQNWNLMSGL